MFDVLSQAPKRPFRLNKSHWLADRLEYWWPDALSTGVVSSEIDAPDLSPLGKQELLAVSLATNPVNLVPTIFGNHALEFNNTSHVGNDNIPVDRVNDNIANGPFTWAAWIKSGSFTSNDALFSIRNGGSTTELLIIYAFDTTGGDGFDIFLDGARRLGKGDPRQPPSLNEWHHFIFTSRSATDHQVFMDGMPLGDFSSNANLTASATNIQIGGWENSQFANDDQIFGVTVHSRGFSAQEAWAWYNQDRWGLYEDVDISDDFLPFAAAPAAGNPWNYYAQQ